MFSGSELGDVVFAVTDAGENSSRTRKKQAEKSLVSSGTRLFLFLVRSPLPEGVSEIRMGFSVVDDLRKVSGGGRLELRPTAVSQISGVENYELDEDARAAVRTLTQGLYQQMGEFYSVEFELPVGVDKARGWKLEVVDAKGKRRKDVEVVYPRKLAPCAASDQRPATGDR